MGFMWSGVHCRFWGLGRRFWKCGTGMNMWGVCMVDMGHVRRCVCGGDLVPPLQLAQGLDRRPGHLHIQDKVRWPTDAPSLPLSCEG